MCVLARNICRSQLILLPMKKIARLAEFLAWPSNKKKSEKRKWIIPMLQRQRSCCVFYFREVIILIIVWVKFRVLHGKGIKGIKGFFPFRLKLYSFSTSFVFPIDKKKCAGKTFFIAKVHHRILNDDSVNFFINYSQLYSMSGVWS